MSESGKAVLALVMIIGIVASRTWVWTNRGYTMTPRIVFPAATFAVVALLVWAITRKDHVPDFLHQLTGGYFERNGFCFTVDFQPHNGVCVATMFYQNRYSRPCRAKILIQPTRKFWLNRGQLSSLLLWSRVKKARSG